MSAPGQPPAPSLAVPVRHVRVGCELTLESGSPAPLFAILASSSDEGQRLVGEEVRRLEPAVAWREYRDGFSNRVWRLVVPEGRFTLGYEAVFEVSGGPDPVLPGLEKHLVQDLPDETIVYTLPSRYCPSDRFLADAWRLFGDVAGGWAQVQAVCDWLHAHVSYGAGSTASTDALEAYTARRGVCRDFAHLGVSFCRALNIPARYVCGYLPDIGVPPDPVPMDFHAWFEVFLGGAWRTFDARHNKPRTGRVVIARGRDAADVAFATTYGSTRLSRLVVVAEEA